MPISPALRPRIPTNAGALIFGEPEVLGGPPIVKRGDRQKTNAIVSLFEALFGVGNPNADLARDLQAVQQPRGAFYNYHIGDLFTPGTQNFVFEPTTELTPLETIWGNAFLRRPNTFSVRQPPQLSYNYTKLTSGIGGLVAGQYALQPLESTLEF